MIVHLEGIGVLGAGLPDWPSACPILLGQAPFAPADFVLPPIIQLPQAERRRTGAIVRLAVAAGLQALTHAGREPGDMATVFTSSGADGETIHAILTVLASEQREISPTRFHNSVHNAPSGYWALACTATAPSTSLCGFDGSFSIGLLDAAAQALCDDRPVTLVAYDMVYPEPLHTVRPIHATFATALVLTPHPTSSSLAKLEIELDHSTQGGTTCPDPGVEALRLGNPAARALPLLTCLARSSGIVHLEGIDGATLSITVTAS